jgi:hypothetical protein
MGNKPNSIPQKRLPPEVRLRNLAANYEALRGQYERQRRLLWLAVHKSGGRVEIDEDAYVATFSAPPEDTFVKVEVDKENRKVVLVFCDENNQRLPESDPKLVVEA